jgi:hypothetical protein
VDAALEQRPVTGQRRVVTPVGRGLPLHSIDVNELELAEVSAGDRVAQQDRQRLVEIVLGHQHLAIG